MSEPKYLSMLRLAGGPISLESNGWGFVRGHWISPKILESLEREGLIRRENKTVVKTEKAERLIGAGK